MTEILKSQYLPCKMAIDLTFEKFSVVQCGLADAQLTNSRNQKDGVGLEEGSVFQFSEAHRLGCVLQCVAVCCSVLQRVAVCCSVLQCVAVRWQGLGNLRCF